MVVPLTVEPTVASHLFTGRSPSLASFETICVPNMWLPLLESKGANYSWNLHCYLCCAQSARGHVSSVTHFLLLKLAAVREMKIDYSIRCIRPMCFSSLLVCFALIESGVVLVLDCFLAPVYSRPS